MAKQLPCPCVKKSQSGFSLLELIIYTAVISTVAAVFIGLLTQLNLGWSKSKTESEVQQNLRLAVENISQSARGASAITFPAPGASATSTTLIINGQTVQYSLNETILQKQTGSNPAENITTDAVKVTYLNFKTFENNATTTGNVITATATSTQFALTVEYNSDNAQFQYTQSATTTEQIRN